MKIGAILRAQQPGVYNKLNQQPQRKKKERKPRKERPSFNFLDRMMRQNYSVDERRCRGR